MLGKQKLKFLIKVIEKYNFLWKNWITNNMKKTKKEYFEKKYRKYKKSQYK